MNALRTITGLVLCAASLQACGGGSSNPADARAFGPLNASAAVVPSQTAARWTPVASDTWEWQLRGTVDTSYNVAIYDIDLFDADTATIAKLHSAGRKVVCYFSAGSSEDWRPDYSQFRATDIGNAMEGWSGENWLDVRSDNVRSIMRARLDLAVSKKCDGVEPDNVDGYANHTGFPLTNQDQYNYNTFLASEAHLRNLAVALKNDVDQLSLLQPSFDFAVNEQCHELGECGEYAVFTSNNKPVLNAEYATEYRTAAGQSTLCTAARTANIRTLVLALELDDRYRFGCD